MNYISLEIHKRANRVNHRYIRDTAFDDQIIVETSYTFTHFLHIINEERFIRFDLSLSLGEKEGEVIHYSTGIWQVNNVDDARKYDIPEGKGLEYKKVTHRGTVAEFMISQTTNIHEYDEFSREFIDTAIRDEIEKLNF